MTIIDKLATSLNRRDEVPNQELAKLVALKNDKKAVAELILNLNNKSKGIQHDCIKVLYEIGELKPALIATYLNTFLELLVSKNNRMQWGAMAAIDSITTESHSSVYAVLPKIMSAAELGSVITRDRAVSVLIKLSSIKQYAVNAFSLFMEQLKFCPANQLPMYAENAMPVINDKNKAIFIETLRSRLDDIEKDTKRKRVEKIIKKLS